MVQEDLAPIQINQNLGGLLFTLDPNKQEVKEFLTLSPEQRKTIRIDLFIKAKTQAQAELLFLEWVNKFKNASEEDSEKAIAESQASLADNIGAKAGDSALKRQQEETEALQKLEKAREEQEQQTAAEKAADERLKVQCILVDYMKQLSKINYDKRNNKLKKDVRGAGLTEGQTASSYLLDNKIVAMSGDTNDFSSYVNGSDVKGKFLDFTTQQISSLVPVIKLYKVFQVSPTNTCDYLIPFSTHAAWREGKTTFGSVEDIFREQYDRPSDVGIKSFNWAFEGSNPVSARRDISAKLVLFSTNLENLVREFNIYPVSTINDPPKVSCFKYVDLALRSGKKFQADKQYDPQYYTIKINISWKTTNKKLFNDDEIKTLEANSTTLLLTLIDHQFSFDQDGSVTFTLDYRAYFEGVLFTESADFIRTGKQEKDLKKRKEKLVALQAEVSEEKSDESDDTSSDKKTQTEKQLDEEYKKYDEFISELNKSSFKSILEELEKQERIFVIGTNIAEYSLYKKNLSSASNGLITNVETATARSVADAAVKRAEEATSESSDTNPDEKLSTLVPDAEVQGIRYFSFFYLGDLIQYAIYSAYKKMDDTPNKPKFIIGSALYRKPGKVLHIERVNIMDIPISVEWFTEWFTMNIISQNRTELPLLYFIRDLCSRLINNIISLKCDQSGELKLKNKFNISNFTIKKENNTDPLFEDSVNSSSDLQVEEIKEIARQYSVNVDSQFVDTSKTIQYISIYCHDISSPVNVNCDEDLKNGIYHFYFGRDRGLVKTINFSRTQVTGVRELNYVRESSGRGLQQLMTPYDVDIKMFGNNLFINGMMIYVNPSGFGRNVGEPNVVDSVAYSLKLGGYHTIYRIESSITPNDFSTTLKARWVGSGTDKVPQGATIVTNPATSNSPATTNNTRQAPDPEISCVAKNYDSGFTYPVNTPNPDRYIGESIRGTDVPPAAKPAGK